MPQAPRQRRRSRSAETLKTMCASLYGYLNNHAEAIGGQRIELKHFLGEPVPDDLHPEMLKR
jgi:hypothetical protein